MRRTACEMIRSNSKERKRKREGGGRGASIYIQIDTQILSGNRLLNYLRSVCLYFYPYVVTTAQRRKFNLLSHGVDHRSIVEEDVV